MPPFDFQGANPFLSPETQKLLDLLMRQSQQEQLAQTEQSAQPVQQPAELPDTKQQIDNTVLHAANPQRPSYLLPQAPIPLQNQYRQALLAQKIAYDAAQDNAQRQQIHDAAEYIRGIGNAAGMDLSGVGEGVSLQDATRNLQSQQAQELMHMYNGRYSMTTDQFFEMEYDRHRMAGASPEAAQLRASRAAREYRAKRMAYLNGLYNSYGRNGLVTNELGNQILLNLSSDDPTAANFYAQIYPNAKDSYARQNAIEDKALEQTNAFAKMAEAFKYNAMQQYLAGDIERQNYGYKLGLDENRAINAENRADKREEIKEQRKFDNRYKQIMTDIQLYKTLVPDADVSEVARAALGWKTSSGKNSESAKTLSSFYKNFVDMKQKQIDSLINQYKDSPDGMPQEIQDEITTLRQQQEQYMYMAEIGLGIRKPDETVKFRNTFTGSQINEILSKLWEESDGDAEKFRTAALALIDSSPITDTKKREILGMLSVYLGER